MISFMIIEDDLECRYLLKMMVEGLGHELICAVDNIASAITYLKAGRVPDIILLDVVLPGGMGTGIIEYVRAIHKDVKIIMTTGLSEERLFKLLPNGGYDAVLQKPFMAEQIMAKVNLVLGISGAKPPQQPPAAGTTGNPAV